MTNLRIGQAAQASGMSAASIRFYEQQGLLTPVVRTENGYRTYSAEDIERLRQIRTCRNLDMSLNEVQQLLSASTDASEDCHMTLQVLRQHLGHVADRIAELEGIKNRLMNLITLCDHPKNAACQAQVAIKTPMPLVDRPGSNHLRHI